MKYKLSKEMMIRILTDKLKKYESLLMYWTGPRSVLKSERLDQSVEFIGNQAVNALRMFLKTYKELNAINS